VKGAAVPGFQAVRSGRFVTERVVRADRDDGKDSAAAPPPSVVRGSYCTIETLGKH